MNWTECVKYKEAYNLEYRFEWPSSELGLGFDCNQALTFNDFWGGLVWIWTWPGDYVLNLTSVKSFFEMQSDTVIGSGWSVALARMCLSSPEV